MSMSTSVHIYPDAEIATEEMPPSGRGYLRILPDPDISLYLSAAIHSDAEGFRRLAAACTELADRLDPQEPTS